jgi:hypothetical protein
MCDYTNSTNESKETWVCKICTYVNENDCKDCQICYTSKDGKPVILSTTPVFKESKDSKEKESKETWVCKICTSVNKNDCKDCQICYTPKDGKPVILSTTPVFKESKDSKEKESKDSKEKESKVEGYTGKFLLGNNQPPTGFSQFTFDLTNTCTSLALEIMLLFLFGNPSWKDIENILKKTKNALGHEYLDEVATRLDSNKNVEITSSQTVNGCKLIGTIDVNKCKVLESIKKMKNNTAVIITGNGATFSICRKENYYILVDTHLFDGKGMVVIISYDTKLLEEHLQKTSNSFNKIDEFDVFDEVNSVHAASFNLLGFKKL